MEVPQRLTLHLCHDEVLRALTLLEDGRSQRYVARVLEVNHSTIIRLAQRSHETGSVARRPGQGRRRVTSPWDDRFLHLTALRTRHRDVDISVQTVTNRLREDNLLARFPAKGPLLTRAHRVARLEFARKHVNWGIEDWENVMFSDESRFSLCSNDRRIPFGRGSIMVWAGISLQGRTDLVPLPGARLVVVCYITDILGPHVIPYGPFIGPNFVYMHDNARPHIARVVRAYFRETDTPVMERPARSSDMNPIEHVWDTLQYRVAGRRIAFRTLQQLEAVLTEEWENIPQDNIVNFYEGMQRRMEAVIQVKGVNTRY
ncbi:hypothetical protein Zmor_010429 [Zophobas morio]|uniref:Transposase Tc1-like domain-containing protein n=1 Tax=Zophobas morio TaxID=2755281 RepID=A0AA38MJV0_9CUCU|nr:hypothetical protein Zmor_010429 [Zophobas morio]